MQDVIWLAADYHFPATYSCRVPMSNMSSAQAMPAPGPATVRLALIRTAIEVFGIDDTRDTLFPIIRSAEVRIRPPEKVAFSTHLLTMYKTGNEMSGRVRYVKTVGYREMAQASGTMTVYLQILTPFASRFTTLLQSVGYWGQGSSMTWCTQVDCIAPQAGEFAIPFATLEPSLRVKERFSCLVSEFRDSHIEWKEIVPSQELKESSAVRLELYVWPLRVIERHSGAKLLHYRSLYG
jgi:hypothetical protein